VISSAGRPVGQPNLKKPTALRGGVGVWDCESSDRIEEYEFSVVLLQVFLTFFEKW